MLEIKVPASEQYDDDTCEFTSINAQTLKLEHSLVSVSKWESKWKKPFFKGEAKTIEETRDYIKCMTLTQNVDDKVYRGLTNKNFEEVTNYIQDSMTATWFNEEQSSGGGTGKKGSSEVVTSEIIYYWMISLQIPFECQKWHINRLLTLIKVCNIKNAPPKKMSKREILNQNRSLNEARKKAMHTSG